MEQGNVMGTMRRDGGAPRRRHTVFRPVAVTALAAGLAAGLLAGTMAPAVATARADSSAVVSKDAAGQDRPELQKAVQAFVDAGFLGVQVRVNDERGSGPAAPDGAS
ncbi:hypothetical protein ACFQQB_60225 [Nonomuraea rubra]|uniref:hypothetical protein n=1 Tax=Nonomuraea rubra TaxID=46180 RepID=UPI003621DED1